MKLIVRVVECVIGVYWMIIIFVYFFWIDLMFLVILIGVNDDCGSWLSVCVDL